MNAKTRAEIEALIKNCEEKKERFARFGAHFKNEGNHAAANTSFGKSNGFMVFALNLRGILDNEEKHEKARRNRIVRSVAAAFTLLALLLALLLAGGCKSVADMPAENETSYDVYCGGKLVAERSHCRRDIANRGVLYFRGGFGADCYCLERTP